MGYRWLLYDKYFTANTSSSVVWKVWVTWNPVWRWKLAQCTVLCFISWWFNLKGKQFANSDLSISFRMSHWINVFIWCSTVTFRENCELSLSVGFFFFFSSYKYLLLIPVEEWGTQAIKGVQNTFFLVKWCFLLSVNLIVKEKKFILTNYSR